MIPTYLSLDEMLNLTGKSELICGAHEGRGNIHYCYIGKSPDEIATNPYIRIYTETVDCDNLEVGISVHRGIYLLGQYMEVIVNSQSKENAVVKKFNEIHERHSEQLKNRGHSFLSDKDVQSEVDFARKLLKGE